MAVEYSLGFSLTDTAAAALALTGTCDRVWEPKRLRLRLHESEHPGVRANSSSDATKTTSTW